MRTVIILYFNRVEKIEGLRNDFSRVPPQHGAQIERTHHNRSCIYVLFQYSPGRCITRRNNTSDFEKTLYAASNMTIINAIGRRLAAPIHLIRLIRARTRSDSVLIAPFPPMIFVLFDSHILMYLLLQNK